MHQHRSSLSFCSSGALEELLAAAEKEKSLTRMCAHEAKSQVCEDRSLVAPASPYFPSDSLTLPPAVFVQTLANIETRRLQQSQLPRLHGLRGEALEVWAEKEVLFQLGLMQRCNAVSGSPSRLPAADGRGVSGLRRPSPMVSCGWSTP